MHNDYILIKHCSPSLPHAVQLIFDFVEALQYRLHGVVVEFDWQHRGAGKGVDIPGLILNLKGENNGRNHHVPHLRGDKHNENIERECNHNHPPAFEQEQAKYRTATVPVMTSA